MNKRIELVGFPKIDRFFPDCVFGCVEAVIRHTSTACDLDPFFFNHRFFYHRKERVEWDGVGNLNVTFSGVPLYSREEYWFEVYRKAGLIANACGLSLEPVDGVGAAGVLDFLEDALRRKEPVIFMFDLFFLHGRREYLTVHQNHAVCIRGLDWEKGAVLATEQMLGHIEIPIDIFNACIAAQFQKGSRLLHRISARPESQRSLSMRETLMDRLQAIVANLGSEEPTEGISGFETFFEDVLESFPRLAEAGRPFYVPGIWRFSHERNLVARYLEKAFTSPWLKDSEFDGQSFIAFIRDLKARWFAFDMRTELAISKKDLELCSRNFESLRILIGQEQQALSWYLRLLSALAGLDADGQVKLVNQKL